MGKIMSEKKFKLRRKSEIIATKITEELKKKLQQEQKAKFEHLRDLKK